MNYHDKYNSFYNSVEWRQLRARKFAEADGLCEECKKKGIIRAGKEVHHRVPIEKDWSKRLDFDNLILLCPECHNKIHKRISPLQEFEEYWEELK